MKLPTSNKTASFGRKPYVKKGYYPAQLLAVKPYADKEGTLIEGTYGHQLIFEFAIFDKDKNDTPTEPMMFEEEGRDSVPVKIPKFVYHEYKNKNKTEDNPNDFQTAITPKSAITGVLQALGWKFSEDDVDIDSLLGKWAEVNVNDYDTKDKEGKEYISSSINDVGEYKGGEIPSDLQAVLPSKSPESVKKQVKHEEVKEKEAPAEKENDAVADKVAEEKAIEEAVSPDSPTEESLKAQIDQVDKLHKDGMLTDDGHKQAKEQLQSQIDALKK